MRILPDQTQRQRQVHIPGSRVYVWRDAVSSVTSDNPFPNEIRFLGQAEALDEVFAVPGKITRQRQNRAPRPLYRPQDQSGLQPQFAILCRETGQALALVRGTPDYIHNEALKLAGAWGGSLRDLVIKLVPA